jgi:Ran GTPase-activating protein (RanGAP) involved in mRNA processing and transport
MDLNQSSDPRETPSSDRDAALSEAMRVAKERVEIAILVQRSTLHEFVLTDEMIENIHSFAPVIAADRRIIGLCTGNHARTIGAIANVLGQSMYVKTVSVAFNQYTHAEDVEKLCMSIKGSSSLKKIHLWHLLDEWTHALVDAMENCTSLVSVTLYKNVMSSASEHIITQFIARRTLVDLSLFFLDQPTAISRMLPCIAGRGILRHLGLNSCNLRGKDIGETLGRAISYPARITSLCLAGCNIGDDGVCAMFDAMGPRSVVRCISMAENDIGLKGAMAIARFMERSKCVRKLHLNDNRINDNGAIAILYAAERTLPLLEEIDLSDNEFSDKALRVAYRIIPRLVSLSSIEMSSRYAVTQSPEYMERCLSAAVDSNQSLSRVSFCSWVDLSDDRFGAKISDRVRSRPKTTTVRRTDVPSFDRVTSIPSLSCIELCHADLCTVLASPAVSTVKRVSLVCCSFI